MSKRYNITLTSNQTKSPECKIVFDLNKIIKVVLTEKIVAVFVNIFANFRHCCLLDFRWFWSTQHSSLILYNIHEMSNSMI